ncbi:hypothetical protein M0805_003923 [Coniferiporia weirii]|nr:hypothetical protein M0805_003923 [Coniferiporia weirii]
MLKPDDPASDEVVLVDPPTAPAAAPHRPPTSRRKEKLTGGPASAGDAARPVHVHDDAPPLRAGAPEAESAAAADVRRGDARGVDAGDGDGLPVGERESPLQLKGPHHLLVESNVTEMSHSRSRSPGHSTESHSPLSFVLPAPSSSSSASARSLSPSRDAVDIRVHEKSERSSPVPVLLQEGAAQDLKPDNGNAPANGHTVGNGARSDEIERVASSSSSASLTAPAPTQKPRSKAQKRSPSPELPPQRPPLQTIRLEIQLGGPDNYSVDIAELARGTGQRAPTPPPVKRDTSESEGEDDEAKEKGVGKGKGRSGKRKSLAAEYYDLEDPFIDDSELAIDERTYFAQTKQQGFYVSSGEVALLKDKAKDRDHNKASGKKPKSKKNLVPLIIPLAGSQAVSEAAAAVPSEWKKTASFGPSSLHMRMAPGTQDTPISVSDSEETRASAFANGLKRKASNEVSTGGKKKRKMVEIEMFHPELQAALHELKAAIAHESFEQKGKFPPTLKPVLARVALKAIVCGEYNDSFFSLMPKLFIYNKFTMTKLIKRTVYADHQKLLLARQDELLEELAQLADDGFAKAQEEYDKSVQGWERRQEKAKVETVSVEGTPAPESATPSVNGAALPGAENMMETDGAPKDGALSTGAAAAAAHSSQHMPSKRYRLTERMRNIIWELVVLSNESCRIENEKNTLENSAVQVSEQGTRKVLYQKIVAAFPEGWMSSGQISREVSVMKKRFEAQQVEEGAAS